ncbi:hypothetical protein [Lactiplantibacillus fabifermentans]|nr:hypothetical protein [Lactiplantibacillus fabifermentans]ETY75589.1 hypothetical protein LFAB_01195 [Lactiplantibacillus fabifermentans T30PCM01]
MQNLDATNIVVAGLVLIYVIKRQLAPRVLRFKLNFYLVLILFGAASIYDAITHHEVTITISQAVLFGTLSILSALIFGGLRAWSYRLWVSDAGLVMRQGTWVTLLFWVLSIGSHALVDRLWTGNSTTLLLYLGLTLLAQRGGVWWLAQRRFADALPANVAQQEKSHHHHHRRSE